MVATYGKYFDSGDSGLNHSFWILESASVHELPSCDDSDIHHLALKVDGLLMTLIVPTMGQVSLL